MKLPKISPFNIFMYIVATAILLFSVTFTYINIIPIDVLKDWELKTGAQEYSAGDTITVTSTFTKVRETTGIAKRYISCSTVSGSSVRIPIGESTADRRADPSKAKNTIYLALPSDIPNLPTKCKLEISVVYNIYGFRNWTETAQSNQFTVNKKVVTKPPTVQTPDTDNQVVEDAPKTNSNVQVRESTPTLAPLQATPTEKTEPQIYPLERPAQETPEESPVSQPPSRNLLERTIDRTVNGINNLIRSIF